MERRSSEVMATRIRCCLDTDGIAGNGFIHCH
jgi:hypothetical protein